MRVGACEGGSMCGWEHVWVGACEDMRANTVFAKVTNISTYLFTTSPDGMFGSLTYLVKLINETHPLVGKHESSSLQCPLPSDWTPLDVGSEPNSRRSLASSIHRPGGNLFHVFEKLRLCSSWVTTEQDV